MAGATSRWIGTLRSAGPGPMPVDVATRLRRRVVVSGGMMALIVVGAAAFWFAVYAAFAPERGSLPAWTTPVAISATGCLVVIVGLTAAAMARRMVRARRALAENVVEAFVLDEKAAAQAMPTLGMRVERMEIVPATGEIVRVNGSPQSVWVSATVVVRAEAPEAGVVEGAATRRLGEEERREVEGAIGLRSRNQVLAVVAFTVWSAAGGVSLAIGAMKLILLPLFGIVTLAAVLSWRRYFRDRHFFATIRRDVAGGVVQRLERGDVRHGFDSRLVASPLTASRIERLPESKMLWTVDGVPAPWRGGRA